jgi:hypothetical protein
MRKTLCIALVSLAGMVSGQQLNVQLSESIHSDVFEKSLTPLPVFRLSNGMIEMNSFEGLPKAVKFKTVLPEIPAGSDTGYFFLYFGGNTVKDHPGYVPVLVVNTCNRKDPYLYIDHNLNFNFTDDGPAQLFRRRDPELIVTLVNPSDTAAKLQYRLTRFGLEARDRYRDMMDEFYRMQEKSRNFVGLRCSFREQRYNCKGGMYSSASDSFTIGLLDVNCNGIYTDAGIDKILLAPFNAATLPVEDPYTARPLPKAETEFPIEYLYSSFTVSGIDRYGSQLTITPKPEETVTNTLVEGQKVPKVVFATPEGKKLKLNRLRRNQVFLYFLRFPYEGFVKDTSTIADLSRRYPKLKIVWIHYGGNPKTLKIISGLPNVTWYTAYTNRAINRKLSVSSFPMGILLAPKRKVKKFGISPQEVEPNLKK